MTEKYKNWYKSSRSGGDDNCVEVAIGDAGTIGVRDTKDRSGPILEFTSTAWTSLLTKIRGGGFVQ
ncbi:MAG: DUF397 domain-containing protein [Micromonosporaceae bacterium]|nr:DUF397 domain-containing protein [Micromonosporaceae bacterium]